MISTIEQKRNGVESEKSVGNLLLSYIHFKVLMTNFEERSKNMDTNFNMYTSTFFMKNLTFT